MSYIGATLLSLQFLDLRTLRFLVRLYPPCVYPCIPDNITHDKISQAFPLWIYILEVISLVPWSCPAFRRLLTWEKIPGFPHFSVLKATESWPEPGNKARKWSILDSMKEATQTAYEGLQYTPPAECSCLCCFWTIFLLLGIRTFAPCFCSQWSWSTGCSLLLQTLGWSYWDHHSCYPKPSRTAVAPVLG